LFLGLFLFECKCFLQLDDRSFSIPWWFRIYGRCGSFMHVFCLSFTDHFPILQFSSPQQSRKIQPMVMFRSESSICNSPSAIM
jgi:hypothetical protein